MNDVQLTSDDTRMEKLVKTINGFDNQIVYRSIGGLYISYYGIMRLSTKVLVKDSNIAKGHVERCTSFTPGHEERIDILREEIRKVCVRSNKITKEPISFDLTSLFNSATGYHHEFCNGEIIVAFGMEGFMIIPDFATGCTFDINVDELRGAFRIAYPKVCWNTIYMN